MTFVMILSVILDGCERCNMDVKKDGFLLAEKPFGNVDIGVTSNPDGVLPQ